MTAYDYDKQEWVEGDDAIRAMIATTYSDIRAAEADVMPEAWYDGTPRLDVIAALYKRLDDLEAQF